MVKSSSRTRKASKFTIDLGPEIDRVVKKKNLKIKLNAYKKYIQTEEIFTIETKIPSPIPKAPILPMRPPPKSKINDNLLKKSPMF